MPFTKQKSTCLVWLFLSVAAFQTGTADPTPAQTPPRILETQLTLRLGPVQGRGTVIAVADDTLTVITAAHFVSVDAAGKTVLVRRNEGDLIGRVMAATPNPNFHMDRSGKPSEDPARGTVGVDTAVVIIKVDLRGEGGYRVFRTIKPADMTPHPIPGGPNQILIVHIVDQFGEEHVVRAGNHLNSKCLAWGRRGYDTRPGDSGAGVFVIRNRADGEPRLTLIGTVSQSDGRGGIASLAHRNDPWIERAVGQKRSPHDPPAVQERGRRAPAQPGVLDP